MSSKDLAATLRQGAQIIEDGYWFRGNRGRQKGVCVYADRVVDAVGHFDTERAGGCLATVTMNNEVTNAIKRYLKVTDAGLNAVYQLNDSQPLETGRQWAIDTLRATADMLENDDGQH